MVIDAEFFFNCHEDWSFFVFGFHGNCGGCKLLGICNISLKISIANVYNWGGEMSSMYQDRQMQMTGENLYDIIWKWASS